MNWWLSAARNERGVALPMALFALMMLTALLLVFLSNAGMEPQISRNLTDVTGARYLAEAGLEWGFDQLVTAAAQANGWNTLLSTKEGQMAMNMPLPGLTATSGAFSVTVRNDTLPSDPQITGQPVDGGGPTTDTNNIVILTSTGTSNGATRQIQQVVTHINLNLPGGLNLPGLGTNTRFSGNSFTITGNDTSLDDTAGSCPSGWGISVATPAAELLVQGSLSEQQKDNVAGKGEHPAHPAQGDNTITSDPSLTPAQIAKFVDTVRPYADISPQASGADRLKYQDIGSTCAANYNDPTCWGTRSNPKIVYVKGSLDPTQAFYALSVSGTSTGAGILIIEDGDVSLTGNFRWEGLIIVTGQYVGLRYGGGGNQTVYGGVIVNESASVDSEVEVDAVGNAKLLYSCQALNNILNMRKLFRITSWREL